jgi:hypothetical protein
MPPALIVRRADGTYVVECPVHGLLLESRHVFGPALSMMRARHADCCGTVPDSALPTL